MDQKCLAFPNAILTPRRDVCNVSITEDDETNMRKVLLECVLSAKFALETRAAPIWPLEYPMTMLLIMDVVTLVTSTVLPFEESSSRADNSAIIELAPVMGTFG
eukprot:5563997-Amphidinium_carterae.1